MTTFTGKIPLFNGENYPTWKTQIEAILHKNRLLSYAQGKVVKPTDETKLEEYNNLDMDARCELIIAMEPAQVSLVRNLKTSHEIWKFLEDTYERKGTRKKVEEFRKLLSFRMLDHITMEKNLIEFNSIINRLHELEAKLDDDLVTTILLDSLPDKYKHIQAAFDAAKEFPTLDALRSSLLEVGDKISNDENGDNLMKAKFYPAKLRKNFKNKNKGTSNFFPFNCHNCGRKGHMRKDCKFKTNSDPNQTANNTTNCSGFIVSETVKNHNPTEEIIQKVTNVNKCIPWCIDSGATSHMCCEEALFEKIDREYTGKVQLADDKVVDIAGIGTVNLKVMDNNKVKTINLYKTLFVPNLRSNLISVSKATDNKCKVVIEGNHALIIKNNMTLVQGYKNNGLFLVNSVDKPIEHCNIVNQNENIVELWHKRYGHLNIGSLMKLKRENMVIGLPDFQNDLNSLNNCVTCFRGKQTRFPFEIKRTKATNGILDLIHTDLCGPMNVESISRSKYFVTFIDDYSRKVFVRFLRKKSEYLEAFKAFKIQIENETNRKIKAIRSDNAAELISSSFTEFLTENGIKRQLTVEYTPQQNGVAERMNRTLVEMARCLMIESDLPTFLWAELVHTAAYLRNHCPTVLNVNRTPEQIWYGRIPIVSHFRQIGCRAFALNKKPSISKWEPRNEEFILVGYSDESKAYRLWKRGTKTIIKSRDVKFIENAPRTAPKVKMDDKNHYEFVLSNPPPDMNEIEESDNNVDMHLQKKEKEKTQQDEETIGNIEEEEEYFEALTETLMINSNDNEQEAEHDNKSANYRSRQQKYQDPKTYEEAIFSYNSKDWLEAMKEEYNSLMKNNTWELCDLPNGRTAIDCKWIYKSKYKKDGTIERRKARLVAKGFSQIFGIDYVETYAPVISQSTLRLVYALSVEYDLNLHHIDISTAFLNGNLEEEIFIKQPKGFVVKGEENKVCKLKKALYGLKQASRQWFKTLHNKLLSMEFKQSEYESCLYFRRNGTEITIIAVYVDDLVLASNTAHDVQLIKTELTKTFEIRDLGEPSLCIGLEINKENNILRISQTGYINNLLSKYGMKNSKLSKIPMQPKLKLQKEPTSSNHKAKVNVTAYQELIGSLMHLAVFSRPDIACTVSLLAQYNQDPRIQHRNAATQLLKYLNCTREAKLVYHKTGKPVYGYVDATWGEDINDRKSQTGYCFVFAGGPISWISKKQPIVALSSAEAEYVALTQAAKEAYFLKYLLAELGYSIKEPIQIYCDNQSAQSIAKSESCNARTKHIDLKFHFIREAVKRGVVTIDYLQTDEMPADALSKPVPPVKHYYLIQKLGMSFNEDDDNVEEGCRK